MDIIVHKLNDNLIKNHPATSDLTTEAFNIQSFSLFCIHHDWKNITYITNAPTLDVYGSNSLDLPFVSLGVGIALSTTTNGYLANFEKSGFAYIQIVYKAKGATGGTISTNINAKII